MPHPKQIPLYVEAPTKDQLIEEMIKINSNGVWHDFFDIQKDGRKWVAWFQAEVKEVIERRLDAKTTNDRR